MILSTHNHISTPALTHLRYRADIDGLRAIAILSVVLFHGFPTIFQGGFIGVDIFFVISGFLITSIILNNLESDTFSFIEFYSRRINRIFPALLLVMCSCLFIGYFIMQASEFTQLNKHLLAGAGFISNFIFWFEGTSGFFDNTQFTKPLLHLWSLSIEEQFYLLWPFLLWSGYKLRLHAVSMILLLAIASFCFNLFEMNNPAADFYSPLCRAWELLVGGVLVRIGRIKDENLANGIALIGMILIIISVFQIPSDQPFPGWLGLLPTIGTACIILGGPVAWMNRYILSHPILVWIGLISYPLYLWHWRLLAFLHILIKDNPAVFYRLVSIAISFALAWITYRWIEQPIRFAEYRKTKSVVLVLAMFGVSLMGIYHYLLS